MTINELLPEARAWIRRSTDKLDNELLGTMSACIRDLERVGIPNPDVDDPLILRAVKLAVLSEYGPDNEKEKFGICYQNLRDSLSLSADYNHR